MSNLVVLGTGMARYEPGFVVDVGPHISVTKEARIQGLFADRVDQLHEASQINLNNDRQGYWPQHRVRLHLHGLPEDVIVRVIA